MFVPKQGLDIATADKFAKTNEIKTTDNDENQQSNKIKHNWQKLVEVHQSKNIKLCTKAGLKRNVRIDWGLLAQSKRNCEKID